MAAAPALDLSLSGSPFHDCLGAGHSFEQCRWQDTSLQKTTRRSSPFHNCLTEGKSFAECRVAASSQTLPSSLTPRGWSDIVATVTEQGKAFSGATECYNGRSKHNDVGADGWLTKGTVLGLADTACKEAVSQLVTATMGTGPTYGTVSKKATGFYDGGAGPIVKPNVAFMLTVAAFNAAGYSPQNIAKQFGQDLCKKGIERLTADGTDCVTDKKVGVIKSKTAVNGGLFDWTFDGKKPSLDAGGSCTNCILSMVLEASNYINPGGDNDEAKSHDS